MMNIIGLKRGIVEIMPFNEQWKHLFNREKNVILKNIQDLIVDIQHVGSTAVPELEAKPIIDIAILIETKSIIPTISNRMQSIGYIDRGNRDQGGGYLLVKELEPEVRFIHLHIVEKGDPRWNNYLYFRDTLRSNEKIRERYSNLKKGLIKKHAADRKGYTAGKNNFIKEVLKKH